MKYQYRWLYCGIVFSGIMLVGYFFDWQASQYNCAELKKQRQAWLQKLASVKNWQTPLSTAIKFNPQELSQAELLQQLSVVAHQSGLIIRSVSLERTAELNVSAEGNYQALVTFVSLLAHQMSPMLLTNFSLHANQSRVTAALNLLPLHVQITNLPERMPAAINNPFCESSNQHFLIPDNAVSFSLREMKMTGFIQQNHHAIAFITLPNDVVTTVTLGAALGKEQGIVTMIKSSGLTLQLPNDQLITISYQ